MSIRKLEEEIGASLFTRHARGVRLTPAGLEALAEAQSTLRHAARFSQLAKNVGAGTAGRLRVGFVASASSGLLQRIIPPYRQLYPNIALELREAPASAPILEGLAADRIDIGIVRTPVVAKHPATLFELQRDRFVVALPPSHPLATIEPFDFADLADQPFVMYRQSEAAGMRSAALLACEQAGFMPRISQEAVQINTILALVESGLGVGLVPSMICGQTGHKLAYREISGRRENPRIGLSMAALMGRIIPAARNFWDLARTLYATQATDEAISLSV